MALKMSSIIEKARTLESIDEPGTQILEETAIQKLYDLTQDDPDRWRDVQDDLLCCGYFDYRDLSLDKNYEEAIYLLNNVTGDSCSRSKLTCTDIIPCPRKGNEWCRSALLDLAKSNTQSVGEMSIMFMAGQILAFFSSMYLLLCNFSADNVDRKENWIKFGIWPSE